MQEKKYAILGDGILKGKRKQRKWNSIMEGRKKGRKEGRRKGEQIYVVVMSSGYSGEWGRRILINPYNIPMMNREKNRNKISWMY